MSALSVTPASVAWVSGPICGDQVGGEAFDAGDCVYLASTGKWLKAQCDGTAAEAGAERLGIALGSCEGNGGRVSIAVEGATVALGTGSAGVVYCPGATPGDLNPIADMASTNKVTPFALGIGSNRVLLFRAYHAGSVLA
jgi:hypothetical protein